LVLNVDRVRNWKLIVWYVTFYILKGEMQKHYVHGVPKDVYQTGDASMRRISVVFRYGKQQLYLVDRGLPTNLNPRDVTVSHVIGSQIGNLEEGKLYSRQQLKVMGAHG
jgi:hypothetical protein